MIYRGFVGKEFPLFDFEITEEFSEQFMALFQRTDAAPLRSLPSNWPAFMALRGSACLMSVWEELGVDPLEVRLIREEFLHFREPELREPLFGRASVQDVSDHMEPDRGIEEQVDLAVRFHDAAGELVAEYLCSYRLPVARTNAFSHK